MNCHNKFYINEKFYLSVVIAIACAVMLPILINGVPYGYDMPHHYQCALTYLDAIKSGDFYPSWTLDRNLGYGALELRMYPPLSHYALAIFAAIFKNWHLASWANYTFWWILGGIGIYLLAREFVKPQAALFAAALFSVMPYRLSQLYLTFLYAELCAITILPFCFLFLTRILKETDKAEETKIFSRKNVFSMNVLGLAFSYAALILTHLPMTLIGTFSLGIYFFAQVRWSFKSLQCAVLKTAYGLSLGLVATSFFWTKVLQERFLMAKNDIYEEIYVYYQYNFLLTWLQKYDEISSNVASNTVVYDVILYLTLLTIFPIAFLKVFSKTEAKNHLWRGVWIIFFMSVFLTTALSRPLWDNLPLLHEVQFSWRWLGIVSIFAPLIASSGFSILSEWFRDGKKRPFALVILGTVFIGLSFPISQSIRGAIYKSPAEINNYVEDIGQKEGFTFWWTIWTRKEFLNDSAEKIDAGGRQVNIQDWNHTSRSFTIETGMAGDVRVATFYHPNWKATVNNQPTEILPDRHGAILIPIAAQQSDIELKFAETLPTIIARYFSGLIWIGLFFFGVVLLQRKYRNSANRSVC